MIQLIGPNRYLDIINGLHEVWALNPKPSDDGLAGLVGLHQVGPYSHPI